MLSRAAYQRILDEALADMTSSEVLQRACSTSSRGSELLRLLSDDVSTQLSLKPSDENVANDGAELMSTGDDVSGKSGARTLSRDDDDMNTKPLPLVVSERLSDARDCRRRHEWCRRKDDASRRRDMHQTLTSSQPLCLRVPSYRRRRSAVAAESAGLGRPVTTDDVTQSHSLTTHVQQQPGDDVSLTSLTASERTKEQHLAEQKSSMDLTRKRRQPEVEAVRVDGIDGDGWAPIDKDVLVGIVERLSVSCLQPPSLISSSSWSSVQTSLCQFRQPLTPTASPQRRVETAGKTRDVMKRAAITPQPLLTLLSSSFQRGSADAAPPRKTQRLSRSSEAVSVLSAGRRRSSVERRRERVQVRDTWHVASSTPRHVWAPLDKSVVLSVMDDILVDDDPDAQPPRRRWLRDVTASSPTHHPATTAAQASFKWKSNILRRMRKEQTVAASSTGRWLDAVPGAVAATGS